MDEQLFKKTRNIDNTFRLTPYANEGSIKKAFETNLIHREYSL